MAEQINSGSGTQYPLIINPDGSINISGTIDIRNISGSITIGSVSANVDSIYVQSGNVWLNELPPTNSIYLNPRVTLVYSGASIGSVYKNTSTGSYLKVLSYDGSDNLIGVSAWTVV